MTTKTFDAVNLMRELRDKLSRDMENMTPEQRMRFIREKAAKTGFPRPAPPGQDNSPGGK